MVDEYEVDYDDFEDPVDRDQEQRRAAELEGKRDRDRDRDSEAFSGGLVSPRYDPQTPVTPKSPPPKSPTRSERRREERRRREEMVCDDAPFADDIKETLGMMQAMAQAVRHPHVFVPDDPNAPLSDKLRALARKLVHDPLGLLTSQLWRTLDGLVQSPEWDKRKKLPAHKALEGTTSRKLFEAAGYSTAELPAELLWTFDAIDICMARTLVPRLLLLREQISKRIQDLEHFWASLERTPDGRIKNKIWSRDEHKTLRPRSSFRTRMITAVGKARLLNTQLIDTAMWVDLAETMDGEVANLSFAHKTLAVACGETTDTQVLERQMERVQTQIAHEVLELVRRLHVYVEKLIHYGDELAGLHDNVIRECQAKNRGHREVSKNKRMALTLVWGKVDSQEAARVNNIQAFFVDGIYCLYEMVCGSFEQRRTLNAAITHLANLRLRLMHFFTVHKIPTDFDETVYIINSMDISDALSRAPMASDSNSADRKSVV